MGDDLGSILLQPRFQVAALLFAGLGKPADREIRLGRDAGGLFSYSLPN